MSLEKVARREAAIAFVDITLAPQVFGNGIALAIGAE
jgi:hypothetical protein